MTEEDAQDWLRQTLNVSRETLDKLARYRTLVLEGAEEQNLIARSTFDVFWTRHIVDSAQLLPLAAEAGEGDWLDLGSGAGMPGLVIACLSGRPMHLVEERRGRIAFLNRAIAELDLPHAQVFGCKVQALRHASAAIISARAFAPLPKLFELAHSFSTQKTVWLLPKGRSARDELVNAQHNWQGTFHVKPSLTDSEAAILVATGVRKAARR